MLKVRGREYLFFKKSSYERDLLQVAGEIFEAFVSYSQQDSRIYCIYETKTKSHEEVIIWHQDRLDRDKNETVIKAAMEANRYYRKSDYWSRRYWDSNCMILMSAVF